MTPLESIVLPYVNPDLDGVACAVALSLFEPPRWHPRVLGRLDAETGFVLRHLGVNDPPTVTDWSAVNEIWLVDTHHPQQLPVDLPNHRVVRITDHHPGGSPPSYPHADIQNEPVGAAATLVGELLDRESVSISPQVAILLQAAIISNTLDFQAPATTARDRGAFDRLQAISALPLELRKGMVDTRRAILKRDTPSLIRTDTKTFETTFGTMIIAQLEAPGAVDVLERIDLIPSLREMAIDAGAAVAALNAVDTQENASAVVATDVNVVRAVAAGLGEQVDHNDVLRVARVLQRKSDLLPYLLLK